MRVQSLKTGTVRDKFIDIVHELDLSRSAEVSSSKVDKNTFESVLMRWMKLEPIIQSEVSQKEKHKYSILTHIYGI